MKLSHLWLPALCASILSLSFSHPLLAFDNAPEATDPDLSLVFPFAQKGEQVVTTEDVLINPGCVIPAGTIFLTIFVPPRAEDADVKRQEKKEKKFIDGAYSRTVSLPERKDSLTPAQKAAFDRATKNPWKSQMIYRAAMKQLRFDEMRLVFLTPGSENSNLEAFDLPEGMLLAGTPAGIKILAIQKDSDASHLGLMADTIILKVNGQSMESLAQFQKVYYAERKAAHEAGKGVDLTVQLPGGAGSKIVSFVPPRKLELNDFFSASDVEREPTKKSEPVKGIDTSNPAPLAP